MCYRAKMFWNCAILLFGNVELAKCRGFLRVMSFAAEVQILTKNSTLLTKRRKQEIRFKFYHLFRLYNVHMYT